jgi:hypothetical protein
MTCTHSTTNQIWVTKDYFGEECEGYWEYETVSTTEDIDTHRYRCTMCKQIMYYSGAAREYYESGIDSKGLFT